MDEKGVNVSDHEHPQQESLDPLIERQKEQESKQGNQIKVTRRPGRPPLRGKPKIKQISHTDQIALDKEQEYENERIKIKEKAVVANDGNLEGFIKIIDYLKKIQCDEVSLHNKMNPYNLMTPTCFWFAINAQYFSFDFFGSRNSHDLAVEFIKKARKTQITLPLRIVKPQRTQVQLQFETQQFADAAKNVTDKLITLINLPNQMPPENIQKSTHLSTIAEDDLFRSSVRAIAFKEMKKRLNSNQKAYASLKSRLENVQSISPKQFASRIIELEEQFKHEHLDVAPQLYYRQLNKKNKEGNQNNQNTKTKPKPKAKAKKSKKAKKSNQDEIFNQSESEQEREIEKEKEKEKEIQQVEQQINIDNQMKDENMEIQNKIKNELGEAIRSQDKIKSQSNEMEEENNEVLEGMEGSGSQQNEKKDQEDNIYRFQKYYDEDDLLLDAIMHLPIDYIITLLQESITNPQIPEIRSSYMPIPKHDPLELVYQIHPQEYKFLDYMKERQEKIFLDKALHSEETIEEKQRVVQVEDAKCQVCTDGDYTEDNLIVFCSMCNISLHQKCVGLTKVPSDNWICEVCAAFGPAGINVPCPLCNVKGGALKRTSIQINNPLFKDTNPSYYEFAKKCQVSKNKEQYQNPRPAQQQGYYDYFSKSTYPNDQPNCHFIWVHYVCAIWVPQCYFQQKNASINIKGIENIDKKRFKQKCCVCYQSRAGASVKCYNDKCMKYYHPECARKKKIYMEQLNLDKLRYLIFCEAHQPLKVLRKIQLKKKIQRDQIIKFCRGIQKYVQTYKIANLNFKLSKIGAHNAVQNSKIDKKDKNNGQQKMAIKIQKISDEDFIRSIIDNLIKQNQIIVKITKIGEGKYTVDEVIKPSKREMRKSLSRPDQFWKNFHNGETIQGNLRRFQNIMKENYILKDRIQNFITYGSVMPDYAKQEKKNKLGRKKQEKQTIIEQEGGIFCICRRPYQEHQSMIQCEVCNEWYHYDCVGFIGSEEDAEKLVFHCMRCLKFQPLEDKKKLLKQCQPYFSQDSIFLNYRPPTPSLQSQQINENPLNIQQNQQFENKQQQQQKIQSKKIEDQQQEAKVLINMSKPFLIQGPIQRNQKISPCHQQQMVDKNCHLPQERQNNNQQNHNIKCQQQNMQIQEQNIVQKIQEQQIAIVDKKQQIYFPHKICNSLNSEIMESGNNQTPFFKHATEGIKQHVCAQLPVFKFSNQQVNLLKQKNKVSNEQQQQQ